MSGSVILGAKGKLLVTKRVLPHEKRSKHRKVLHQGEFIRIMREGIWEFVERVNCKSIVMMAGMTKDKKVVFVEQYRTAIGVRTIEFPAGLVNDIDKTESPETAALREYEEETGYRAKKMVLMSEGYANPGLTTDWVGVYKAAGLTKVSSGGGDPHEDITVHEVPLKKCSQWFKKMIARGIVVDPKVYLGLYFLER